MSRSQPSVRSMGGRGMESYMGIREGAMLGLAVHMPLTGLGRIGRVPGIISHIVASHTFVFNRLIGILRRLY
jgi:hypothetical protein